MTELLTTRQVQELLHIDRTTIYRLVASGRLSAIRVGKQWRFTRTAIESLLQQRAASVPVAAPSGKDNDQPWMVHMSSASIQRLQDLCAELLGVMLLVTDMQGNPVTEPSNVCDYYRSLIWEHGLRRLCDETWPQLAAALPLQPRFVSSQFGPLCARAFIRVDNRLAGMLVAGCVAPARWPPVDETLDAAANKAGIDRAQIACSADAVYHLTGAERERVLDILQRMADIISQMIVDYVA